MSNCTPPGAVTPLFSPFLTQGAAWESWRKGCVLPGPLSTPAPSGWWAEMDTEVMPLQAFS